MSRATVSRQATEQSCVDYWLRQARLTPLLTPAEELLLARLVRRGQRPGATRADLRASIRAKRRMVAANMRLVVTIAKPFRSRLWATCLQFEDLLQEGCVGLVRAAEKFDPEAGYKFSTYAFHWVRQSIGRALEVHTGMARLPARLTRELARRATQPLAGGNVDDAGLLGVAQCLLTPVSIEAPLPGLRRLHVVDVLADPSPCDVLERLDLNAAMECLIASGEELQPLLRVTVGEESLTRLSLEHGVSKQAFSQRLKRHRARLAVVASPYRNLISEAG